MSRTTNNARKAKVSRWKKEMLRSFERSEQLQRPTSCSYYEAFPAPGKRRKVSPLCHALTNVDRPEERPRKRRILGVDPPDEPAQPRRYARDTNEAASTPLQKKVRRMYDKPTRENIGEVLDAATLDDSLRDVIGDVLVVAEAEVEDRLATMLNNPTEANARDVLDWWAEWQLSGGENSDLSARVMEGARWASRRLAREAKRKFFANTSDENYAAALDAIAVNQLLGGDMSFGLSYEVFGVLLAGDKLHTVGPGDTLRGLAERYYTSPDYWYVIFEANLATLSSIPDGDHLPAGVVLNIP